MGYDELPDPPLDPPAPSREQEHIAYLCIELEDLHRRIREIQDELDELGVVL